MDSNQSDTHKGAGAFCKDSGYGLLNDWITLPGIGIDPCFTMKKDQAENVWRYFNLKFITNARDEGTDGMMGLMD